MNKESKDFNLLLLYLNSWEEDSRAESGGKIFRAWKNYPYEVLNELERENLIRQYPKSVIITKEGLSKALGLKRQLIRA